MRFLLYTFGSHGDVQPLVALAIELQSRGAEALLCAPQVLPSPDYRPLPRPGKPFPEGENDNRVLWDLDAEKVQVLYGPALNAHREAAGLPPVHNVRDHTFTDTPWLADDPGVCVISEVNHRALFQRVDAVIHHGGAGTTTTARRRPSAHSRRRLRWY